MSIFTAISSICIIIFLCESGVSVEIQFDRIELLNSSYIEGAYNVSEFRITKFNRTTYVFNTKAELFIDIDRNMKVQVNFHHNRFNNNQYTKTPMAISKDLICKIADKYYEKFIMIQVKNVSNFPQIEAGQSFCPVQKVFIKYFII